MVTLMVTFKYKMVTLMVTKHVGLALFSRVSEFYTMTAFSFALGDCLIFWSFSYHRGIDKTFSPLHFKRWLILRACSILFIWLYLFKRSGSPPSFKS